MNDMHRRILITYLIKTVDAGYLADENENYLQNARWQWPHVNYQMRTCFADNPNLIKSRDLDVFNVSDESLREALAAVLNMDTSGDTLESKKFIKALARYVQKDTAIEAKAGEETK